MKHDRDFDIAIIGAGPAGIAAAISIPHVFSVVHFEKSCKPVKKLCGGLLTQDAIRHIRQLTGVDKLPNTVMCDPITQILRSVDFDCGMTTVIDVGYENIDRKEFDAWLTSYVNRSSYQIQYSARVVDIKKSNGGYIVTALTKETLVKFRVKIIIDCSGWASIVGKIKNRRKLARRFAMQFAIPYQQPKTDIANDNFGEGNKYKHQEYRAFFSKQITDWFGWTIPKNDEVIVGLGFQRCNESINDIRLPAKCSDMDVSCTASNPELPLTSKFIQFVQQLTDKGYLQIDHIPDYLDTNGIKSFFAEKSIKGCPITSLTSIKQLSFGENNIFILGEAAGLVSPSSGDGISYALSSGIAVGKTLEKVSSKNGRNSCHIDQDDHRLFSDLLAYETRELRFNVQKAKMLSNPKMRNAALWFLSWHNGKSMERMH